jgi:tetratricopeptide (TPR) repeat protein
MARPVSLRPSNRRGICRVLLFSTAVFTLSTSQIFSQANPNELFAQGKYLIERNCAECRHGSKRSLEEGVMKVNQSLTEGFADKRAAMQVLAGGYNNLATYAAAKSPERAEYLSEKRKCYITLARLYPSDPDILFSLAQSEADINSPREEQLEAYRRVLRTDQHFAPALFAVGVLLIRGGDSIGGTQKLKEAFENSGPEHVALYGGRLIRELNNLGREGEARAIRDEIAQRSRLRQ